MVTKKTDQPLARHDLAARLHAVPETDDVISYTLACAATAMQATGAATLNDVLSQAVTDHVHKTFAGEQLYVCKRLQGAIDARNTAIRRDYWQHGEHIPLLVRRYGLTERRIRQIIAA